MVLTTVLTDLCVGHTLTNASRAYLFGLATHLLI